MDKFFDDVFDRFQEMYVTYLAAFYLQIPRNIQCNTMAFSANSFMYVILYFSDVTGGCMALKNTDLFSHLYFTFKSAL